MLRIALKWLGALLGLAVLVAAVFLINLVWFRPFSLDLFYEKVFVQFALRNPELLTQFGIAEQFGYRRHNAHLDDLSVAKTESDSRFWRAALADLKTYDPARQNPEQRLSTRVLDWYLQGTIEGEKFRYYDYPVNQLSGVQSQTIDFLLNQHAIDDQRGAQDYLKRLAEIPRKFDQLIEQLQAREKLGILPPRFVIERVLTQMRAFEGMYARDNPLYVHFSERAHELKDTQSTEVLVLQATCAGLVENSVRPAYRRLIAFFEGQLQRATNDDGVWKLPDGAAYYAYRLRIETTTRMTPLEVHDLGLAEVARIETGMRTILASQQALRAGETPAQALDRLGREPRFLYSNDDVGRNAALTEYRRMIADQVARAHTLFGHLPRTAIEVKRVPEFKEKTAPGAYYTAPALDGTRPGVFWANLRDMSALPKFGMRTLSIHEGVPGHHFQLALAQEQVGGPTFRKVLPFTAYQEGWALYAEWLGTELGVYEGDLYGDLGRLQAEMFRAVRLVVDTGIHFKRWPRAQAIAYMIEKTGMAEGEVTAEIERYIVNPGQACAYKIGMLRIQAARRRAQQALGTRWDPAAERAFHDLVLGGGALPLEVLDQQVDDWVRDYGKFG
jgi:uncharacterized protein (DUF885 family)